MWGHQDGVVRRLWDLADSTSEKHFEDCYLLTTDPTCNLKIRRNRLKIKRLVEERLGFQHWSTRWHRLVDPTARRVGNGEGGQRPAPASGFGGLGHGADSLAPISGVRPIFVVKHRLRFRFGSVRAEVADFEVGGRAEPLYTTAIEGRDLGELVRLRSALGLDRVPNVAVHLAIDRRLGAG